MFSKLALSALAVATVASAQSSCTQSTFTIGSAAEATALSNCRTLKGDVLIPASSDPQIDLSGPSQIDGDLTLENNGAVISLTSETLNAVSGTFRLANVTLLSTLNMPALTSVGTITWQSLPALNSLSFSSGVSRANTVTISDTFLSTLDGIDLESVGTMDINNNRRLTKFDTSLKNLTENLNIQANGQRLSVTMPNLVWIANMTIANVTEFSSPSLEVVNGSARFDSNYFESFAAPNMTATQSGDISFINNPSLTNITFSGLKSLGGALTVINNTRLEELTGFPELAELGGAIQLGGNFSSVDFPSLEDVKGTFKLSSTNDISSACDELKKLAPGSQGGNGVIQGKFTCTSNNEKANTGNTDGGSSSSGSSNDSSAAVSVHVNSAVIGLSFVGLLAQLL